MKKLTIIALLACILLLFSSLIPSASAQGDGKIVAVDDHAVWLKQQYEASYRRYVEMIQQGYSPGSPELQAALSQYKKTYTDYNSHMCSEYGVSCDTGDDSSRDDEDRQDTTGCGNGVCDTGECDEGCTEDCSFTECCGDGTCQERMWEDYETCPEDCRGCGDGECDAAEDCKNCFEDCFCYENEACEPSSPYADGYGCVLGGATVCGDLECEEGECETGCTEDCSFSDCCGDGSCDPAMGEDVESCVEDCTDCDAVCKDDYGPHTIGKAGEEECKCICEPGYYFFGEVDECLSCGSYCKRVYSRQARGEMSGEDCECSCPKGYFFLGDDCVHCDSHCAEDVPNSYGIIEADECVCYCKEGFTLSEGRCLGEGDERKSLIDRIKNFFGGEGKKDEDTVPQWKRRSSQAYQEYISAYNELTDLMAQGKGDSEEAQDAYARYKEAKEKYETLTSKGTDDTGDKPDDTAKKPEQTDDTQYTLDTSQIEAVDNTLGKLKSASEQLAKLTDDPDELEALKEYGEAIERLQGKLEYIQKGTELYNILFTEGPEGDWRDIEYNDAKPGFLTRFKRGFVDFFKGKSDVVDKADEVLDLYSAMDDMKGEQAFYSQDVQARLAQALGETIESEIKDYAQGKIEDASKAIIGKAGGLAVTAIQKPLEYTIDESKKPEYARYYYAYKYYRENGKSHEEALQSLDEEVAAGTHSVPAEVQLDAEETAGRVKRVGLSSGGYGFSYKMGDIHEMPYYKVDRDVFTEAMKKIYEKDKREEGR